ncbi:MAG: hypothetical protein G01um101448_932 [Parcubacteria group bacterium Gr01-1014_48]|nr:MAG: hypothetical protein G01um101448_932 [Parcubacteria group bacterium Gr01-1014_48]
MEEAAQNEPLLPDIQIALESYKEDNKKYPQSLNELATIYFANILTDPISGAEYAYAVLPDGSAYHLGATVPLDDGGLSVDADFDSAKAGYTRGFSGEDDLSCDGSTTGACYDLTSP